MRLDDMFTFIPISVHLSPQRSLNTNIDQRKSEIKTRTVQMYCKNELTCHALLSRKYFFI